MNTANAAIGLDSVVSTPSFKIGSPVTLGVLCLVAASLGAMLGAVLGSKAEQDVVVAEQAASTAAEQATIKHHLAVSTRLEQQLADRNEQLKSLSKVGVLQEANDVDEAGTIGLTRALTADLARMPPDDGRRILAALVREARENGLDPIFLAALIRVETHFDPYATSHVGAMGLMQLMPATAAEVAHKKGIRFSSRQLFNPTVNIQLGSAYIKTLINRFGDVRTALIAYNAGPSLARHAHLSAGVRAYPRNVLAEYERLTMHAHRGTSPVSNAIAAR